MLKSTKLLVYFLAACFLVVSYGCEDAPKNEAQNEAKTDKSGGGNASVPSAQEDLKPVDGDWLIYNLGADPTTLNPITGTDSVESAINNNIYETLIKRDNETLELMPHLAESWEISEDKLQYTFHLRNNVKWHDGVPFTAKDIVFSYEKINDPTVDAPHLRNYYKDVKKVEALDDHTVKFTYAKPYFLALEFCGGMSIVPKHIFEKGDFNSHPGGREPVGTGPYKFVKWDTGQQIVLERNEDYWGDKPHIMRVVYRVITDDTVALQVLKRGDIDINSLNPIQWSRQTASSKFTDKFYKLDYFTPNYRYIGWNSQKPYFSDVRVRTAMTHLVNRELILAKIMYGLGEIVTSPFYIKGPVYDKSIEPIPYDPEKAKKLLDEAGWIDSDGDGIRDKDGLKFEFGFMFPNGAETSEKIATILKEELDKIGILMNIRKIEWAVFVSKIQEKKFDAVILGWSMGVESDPYQVWHSSQSQADKGSNFVGFENARADELIDQARTEFDKEKRIKLYREFAQIIHEEQPYTFLFCQKSLVALNNRFKNVKVYSLGLDFHEWFVPKELQKYGKD